MKAQEYFDLTLSNKILDEETVVNALEDFLNMNYKEVFGEIEDDWKIPELTFEEL